ncbi:MAG: lysoplasmalogenase family protein [Clostridia bacterium]|nr:lysoplasmalogenase family protein [Clostridia bacterium]
MKNRGHLVGILFVGVQLCLYLLFLFVLTGRAVSIVQFASICLCFVFALLFSPKCTDSQKLKLALLFTLAADFFLVILQKHFLVAVIIFSFAQLCYISRIRNRAVFISLPLTVAALMLLSSLIIGGADVLVLAGCAYFGTLINAAVFAWLSKNRRFALGMTLFLCCDIFVALSNSANYINIDTSFLARLPIDPIWAFYLPAQVLLAMSAKEEKNENPQATR